MREEKASISRRNPSSSRSHINHRDRYDCLTNYCDKRVEDIGPDMVFSILLGVVFGSLSQGFFYYVLYSILSEIIYAASIRGYYTPQNTIKRLGIYSAGLLAFIIVRVFVCDDDDPFKATYDEAPTINDFYVSVTCQKPGKGNRLFGRRGRKAYF